MSTRYWLPSIAMVYAAIALTMPRAHGDTSADYFENTIRPLLASRCYECHSATKADSGLRLDSRAGFLAGGVSGRPLVPTNDSSGILLVVLRGGQETTHPDVGLTSVELDALREWVSHGANWPEERITSHRRSSMAERVADSRDHHWAFQPVVKPPLPDVRQVDWVRTNIDRFILAKLEASGLAPAPTADRRTLLRRAYYDLIGLPPTYEALERFVQDESPDAFDTVIEELLGTEQYGERWGRHWLDVARYSDTIGQDARDNNMFPFSYTYRDYVIRAFNEDLPYDRFIIEQLAADQLELGEDKRSLAALGFITLGRQFPADPHATLDDQIDVVTRGLMGLTVSCARCHDHKHDPIPTADYYSLYGVFRGARTPAELPPIGGHASDDAQAAYADELKKLEEAQATLRREVLATAQAPADSPLSDAKKFATDEDKGKLAAQRAAILTLKYTHPGRPNRAMAIENTPEPFDPYIFNRGNASAQGEAVPRRFLEVLSRDERAPFPPGKGRLALAQAIASPDNPLTARVLVNRVWMHHFSRPIVATPSDFGLSTEAPPHLELLDYLAARFVNNGWSIKNLHRIIMRSAAYQQASREVGYGLDRDVENTLLWRQNRRRLDFEATRDSLLRVAANLDLRKGGVSEIITEAPFSTRRTVYAQIDRQYLPSLFGVFDFAVPNAHSAKRAHTTVPQQALFMMNSPFVADQAKRIAARATDQHPDAEDMRVRSMYQQVYGRDPSQHEIDLAMHFLSQSDDAPILEPDYGPRRWLYGYGAVDEENERVTSFTEFPHWNGEVYQGGEEMPAEPTGLALLSRHGGHPGESTYAVIRRWVSPADSTLSFVGELYHYSTNGDGVRGYVISNREGIVWQGDVQDGMIPTVFHDCVIRKGDTIDLIVACKGDAIDDRFRWHPRLYLSAEDAAKHPKQDWLTRFDFGPPPPKAPEPLEPWEKYAQVLLMSNEFIFVD